MLYYSNTQIFGQNNNKFSCVLNKCLFSLRKVLKMNCITKKSPIYLTVYNYLITFAKRFIRDWQTAWLVLLRIYKSRRSDKD